MTLVSTAMLKFRLRTSMLWLIQAASCYKRPRARGLPLKFTLLPEYLKSMGYTTRIVGKWHLGMFRKEYTPTFRGFDSHYGYWTGRLDYYNHRLVYNHTLGGYDFRKNMDVEYAGVGKYATDLFTEEGVKIINEHNPSVPLFLYLPHLATHVGNDDDPLQAPVEAVERFSHIKGEKRRIFAAMLWKLDESIGKVVEALKDNDMLKDSIIIFSTDNGGSAGGLENSAGSNWPLKGNKNLDVGRRNSRLGFCLVFLNKESWQGLQTNDAHNRLVTDLVQCHW
ncbi:Arylsulfatase B [Armadillidium vulgare]|nr:Arylsulfatase B [Armadillidium vulgare]